jgi:hypothetical protein
MSHTDGVPHDEVIESGLHKSGWVRPRWFARTTTVYRGEQGVDIGLVPEFLVYLGRRIRGVELLGAQVVGKIGEGLLDGSLLATTSRRVPEITPDRIPVAGGMMQFPPPAVCF